MVELLPAGIAQFGKRLQSIDETKNGLMEMTFTDGSTATADAILGCDGIKSRVRQIMFGENHPCAHPTYTHKYAYRALVPMEDAVAAMGEEKAMNSCMHVSQLLPSIDRCVRLTMIDGSKRPHAHVPDQSWSNYERRSLSVDRG